MQGFSEGYEFFRKNAGGYTAADHVEDYIDRINTEIDNLINDLNAFEGFKTDSSKLQGDIAEFWHADTFNINAAVRGSDNYTFVDRSHDFASADVSTNFGDKYGLKYYENGVASAKAQAKSVFERFKEYQIQGGKDSLDEFLQDRGYSDIDSVLNDPIYTGQKRLIPKDQLVEATEWLKRKIEKESVARPEQVERYKETLALLEDRIRDNEGTESIPLSRKDSQRLAELAKQGKVNAKDLGLTTEELVTYEYILQQALKAGMTAATISIVLKVAPEIIKAIQYLIENGKIDAQHFRSIGFAAISGAADGFIKGFLSAAITAACKAGRLGQTAKSVNSSLVAMAVVLVIDTMKNAFNVALGKMSHRELADALVKESFIASISLISGSVVQAVLPVLPALGFMLGSFIGSVVGGYAYTGGYNLMISFCIDTGFTMFGLVHQNYVLPSDVIDQIGIELFKVERYQADYFDVDRFEPERFEPERFESKTFRPFFLRRGVIGIREIGYTS